MQHLIRGARLGVRVLAAASAAALVAAAPAAAASTTKKTASNAAGCVVDHVLSNPFAAWSDHADYALAPGGDFESGAAGWTLAGGAAVVAGNQPFDIGTGGTASLRLPAGASVVSAPMCIDSTYPHFRLFGRNTGGTKGSLNAQVLYTDGKGKARTSAAGTIAGSTTAWSPTAELKIAVPFDADAAAPVQFRFTAGKGGDWRIDDVYVDPRMRR